MVVILDNLCWFVWIQNLRDLFCIYIISKVFQQRSVLQRCIVPYPSWVFWFNLFMRLDNIFLQQILFADVFLIKFLMVFCKCKTFWQLKHLKLTVLTLFKRLLIRCRGAEWMHHTGQKVISGLDLRCELVDLKSERGTS